MTHDAAIPPGDPAARFAWRSVVEAAVTEPQTARLRYAVGSEYSPADPWGRLILDLNGGGGVHLERRQRGKSRAWFRRLDEGAFERLLSRLSAGAWQEPPQFLVPDSTVRSLELSHGSQTATLLIEWHAAGKVDGLREAFEILDAMVDHIAGTTQG